MKGEIPSILHHIHRLIDSLDTLAVLGNYSEFRRVYRHLAEKASFDADINVSVFETNIRDVFWWRFALEYVT